MKPVRFLDRRTPPHIVTLVLFTALSALTMNIFIPSLPAISLHFGADKSIAQLGITLYLFSTGFLQLFLGPFSDYYGRRPVILFGLIMFFVGTITCIFAPTIEVLLVGRMLQAFSAAGLVTGRAIIRDMVSRDRAASMIGYVTMAMAVAPMMGPVLGGYLDEIYGWQASFWLLIGCGTIVLAITWLDLGETSKSPASNLTSQFRTYPTLFMSRRFWGYALTALFCSGSFFAYIGGAPYVASQFFELTPSVFGAFFASMAIGYMAGNFLSGRFTQGVGITKMMIYGNIVLALSIISSMIFIRIFPGDPVAFFIPLIFVGVGNGMALPSANSGIVSVRPKISGAASGLGGFLQITGGASLSLLAGFVLGKNAEPTPLLVLMLVVAILAICSALYVVYVDALERKNESEIQYG